MASKLHALEAQNESVDWELARYDTKIAQTQQTDFGYLFQSNLP